MTDRIERELVQHHDAFVAFARQRLGDPELAADVVQESFAKAIKSAAQLRDGESVVAWYYRILRRTIIDLYRRNASRRRMLERAAVELPEQLQPEIERQACACMLKLIPALKPEYADILKAVDIERGELRSVAKRLGITPNNLNVRLHRARQQLKERLEQTCNVCAKHGCVDCTCE